MCVKCELVAGIQSDMIESQLDDDTLIEILARVASHLLIKDCDDARMYFHYSIDNEFAEYDESDSDFA